MCRKMLMVVVLSGAIAILPIAKAAGFEMPLFSDDFESYPVGTFPSAGGWILVWNGRGNQYQVVTDAYSFSPTKSLQLWGQPNWSSVAQKKFSTDATVIGYECAMRIDSIGTGGPGRVETVNFFNRDVYIWGRGYAVVLFNHDDGKIKAEDGTILGDWVPGIWYHVKTILDRSTNTYSTWIDGQLKGQGLSTISADTHNINALALMSDHAGVKVYFDDVRVFEISNQAPIADAEEFIILSTYNGTSIMLSFNEEGRFDPLDPIYPGSSSQCYGVGMADFDGDGDFDFVLGSRFNGNILYYEKTGPGNSFAEPVIVGTYSGYPLDFAVEDYNRDGNYDFIFTNFGGTAYLFEGLGDGTFTSRTFSVPPNCIAADSGDFNNDGIPDFALQSYGSGDAVFFIYLGEGDGTFTASAFTGVFTTRSWGLTASDFDGDGNIDILAGGGYYGTSFYLYPGNGDGTFGSGSHVVSLGPADNSPADNYDFNHDGFMDFACLKANERAVYVFFGDGTGSFMPAPENPIRVQTNATLYGIATPPHQVVLTPQEAIEQLIDQVADLNLQKGIDNSLDAKLEAAFRALDDVNANNNVAAINTLQAFINAVEAQRGNKIPEDEADALIEAVNEIIAMLSSV